MIIRFAELNELWKHKNIFIFWQLIDNITSGAADISQSYGLGITNLNYTVRL